MPTRVQLLISDEAAAIIAKRSPNERRRGEWVSQALVDYEAILTGAGEVESCGTLEAIEERLRLLSLTVADLARKVGVGETRQVPPTIY